MNDRDELLNVSEAARDVGVSAQTIRHWADTGKIPATRTPGGVRLFRRDDVTRLRDVRMTEKRVRR